MQLCDGSYENFWLRKCTKQKKRGCLELPAYKKGAEYILVEVCKEMMRVLCEKVQCHDTALCIHTCQRQTVPGHAVLHLRASSFAVNLSNSSRVNLQPCNSSENPQGLQYRPMKNNPVQWQCIFFFQWLFLHKQNLPFRVRFSGESHTF